MDEPLEAELDVDEVLDDVDELELLIELDVAELVLNEELNELVCELLLLAELMEYDDDVLEDVEEEEEVPTKGTGFIACAAPETPTVAMMAKIDARWITLNMANLR